PIGAVLTPLLQPDPKSAELANASTLCGACFEACPVKIPLHDMLVRLRRRNGEQPLAPASGRAGCALFARRFSSARLLRLAGGCMRFVLRRLRDPAGPWAALGRRFGPVARWSDTRALPRPPARAFRPAPGTDSAQEERS